LLDRLQAEIRFEIQQIDELLHSYEELLERLESGEPDLVETTATASVLHSFYNGIENIFLRISKEVDGEVPAGDRWHREVLTRMTVAAGSRPAVISADLGQRLAEYLSFRHFYRHSYSFFLDWAELEHLVRDLGETWSRLREELSRFQEALEL
jgi:hypothetical protein